jgi:6-pyruvoyltetrahydropterin/6-carboxytetrahydropterin synthase
MFEISVEETFSSGHALRGYRGKCENPHGHNYRVQVILHGAALDNTGLLYDFSQLKKNMSAVIAAIDHRFLNDQAPFDAINPSAENIAKYFYDQLSQQFAAPSNGARIARIAVWETDTTCATYWPGEAQLP